MALKLIETLINGVTADHWKITDCNVATGQVCLGLFFSKEHATNRRNMLGGRTSISIDFVLEELEVEGMNAIKYSYLKIKASKMLPVLEMGEIVMEDGVPLMKESNKFVNAEDC
jgi:hypothetical protein